MNPPRKSEACDLCGLPLTYGRHALETPSTTYRFCCMGCRQVFAILMEAADTADPARFRETDLFRECLAAGIIPGSEKDLAQIAGRVEPEPNNEEAPENTLALMLKVDGMWCPACAWVIERTLRKRPGVFTPVCHFTTDTLQCRYDPLKTDPEQIAKSVERLGYNARSSQDEGQKAWKRQAFIRFAISLLLTMNVMMLSFALYSGFFTDLPPDAVAKISWPIFALATVVMFYGGLPIHQKAISGLAAGAPGMETLISIGAFSAYGYSVFNLLAGSIHLYFDTASMLITLVLLGKTIERQARDRIVEGLESIFSLKPTKVRICSDDFPMGRFVDAGQLATGSRVRVDTGEIIPVDGLVVSGEGAIDTSSLSGEATPVHCRPGDRVTSGTRLLEGGLTVDAVRVGSEATLGRMIETIHQALHRKSPMEGKTDRLLFCFTPLVVFLAAATAATCLSTGPAAAALERAVTVLVISCPCALGIAIPLARVAGIALAGRSGILIREFSAFEASHRVDTLVLDKTGTLTEGQWALVALDITPPHYRADILQAAAALEAEATHPAAGQILQLCRREGITPAKATDTVIFPNGVSGWVGGCEVRIGSRAFISGPALAGLPEPAPPGHGGLAESRVFVQIGHEVCAAFRFGDRLRQTAAGTISALKARGLRLILVSGDGKAATAAVAEAVGIDEFSAHALPEDKAALVSSLCSQGRHVAMVGDGINDAPALAGADLSIALNTGAPLGREAAHVTLLRPDPAGILTVLDLTRRINGKIHQNLGFSLVYNLVAIPLAMSGLLTPLIAVTAMLLSSLSVTANTLLLLKKKARKPQSIYSVWRLRFWMF
ncbi:MAG: heavy metal translocating P-type ATPase [Desulfobacterales bacterium]|nr:heavy metal translocating P-type ATPase [Desulfobacterales bacterium]